MKTLTCTVLVALAAGCSDGDDDIDTIIVEDPGVPGDDNPIPPDTTFLLHADILSYDIYNPLNGAASVEYSNLDQAFFAAIEIRNDIPGAIRPWHVHYGTCGSGGPIVGPDSAYPRLFVGGDGYAVEQTIVLATLDRATQYHVNVHESDAQFSLLIACGDLVRAN